MKSTYSSIHFADIEQYLPLFAASQTTASDYSFANIWGWAPYYNMEWRLEDNLCWIRQTVKGETTYWAPIGDWGAVKDWSVFPELVAGNTFIRIPEALKNIWEEKLTTRIAVEEARGQWDYLYLAEELMTLAGNRFHKKKNLVNQFEKNYIYTYSPLAEKCVETVLQMQQEWCQWRDCDSSETLLAENDAVARVLTHWKDIPGLCGGIIRIDDKPVAYTMAENLGDDTLVIHFEKGAPNIKGVYQAINYLFANDAGKKVVYLNREQDLDEDGLRRAKLSYNPVDFIKKYTIRIVA